MWVSAHHSFSFPKDAHPPAFIHTQTHASTPTPTQTHEHTHTHARAHTCAHAYTYTHIHTHTLSLVHSRSSTETPTPTPTPTPTHTCTHTPGLPLSESAVPCAAPRCATPTPPSTNPSPGLGAPIVPVFAASSRVLPPVCACAWVGVSSPALLMLSVATPGARIDTENVYPPRAGPRGRSLCVRREMEMRVCECRALVGALTFVLVLVRMCACVRVSTSFVPWPLDAECSDPGRSHGHRDYVPTTRRATREVPVYAKERWRCVCVSAVR